MLRRSFFQAIAGGIAAVKSYAGVKIAQARVGSPTGWKITWSDLPTGAGCWTALPETADRNIAFRSVTSAGNDKLTARKRVVAMIQASKNGSNLLTKPIGMESRLVPAGLKLTTGSTAEDIAYLAEAERRAKHPSVIAVQNAFSECWYGSDYPSIVRCGAGAFRDIVCLFGLADRGFFAKDDGLKLLNGCATVVLDESMPDRNVSFENTNYPDDKRLNRTIVMPNA